MTDDMAECICGPRKGKGDFQGEEDPRADPLRIRPGLAVQARAVWGMLIRSYLGTHYP